MNQAEIRQTLLKRQNELRQRLAAIEDDLQRSHSPDWNEQAIERENDEVLEALASETMNELTQLRHVLKKMTGHNYGICSNCGQPIESARLVAIPEADLCITCATEH